MQYTEYVIIIPMNPGQSCDKASLTTNSVCHLTPYVSILLFIFSALC